MKGTTEKAINQKGEFISLMRVGLPLMKNVLTPLPQIVLLALGVIAAASATDAAIQKKIYRSGMTTLIISKKEIKDIQKIVKHLKKSGLKLEIMGSSQEKSNF